MTKKILNYSRISDKTFGHKNIKVTRVTRTNGKRMDMNHVKAMLKGIIEKDPTVQIMIRAGTIDNQFRTLKGYNEDDMTDEDDYYNEYADIKDPSEFMQFYYADIYIMKKLNDSIFEF